MDHDRLFKELLRTFFVDFIELFFPDLLIYLDRDSVTFLDKELFTDVTQGDRHEVDLVAKARFRGQELCFLIHVETQAQPVANFPRRMFNYFARLHELHDLPVYPIAVLSFDAPRQPQPNAYDVAFPDLHVLQFQYRTVQLNELRWADFLQRTNPVAAALMAKMRIDPHDRPRVKLACLRMLAKLQLDPARMQLISGFVDSYLELTMDQQTEFDEQLSEIAAPEQEQVMEIVTSWMKQGSSRELSRGSNSDCLASSDLLFGNSIGKSGRLLMTTANRSNLYRLKSSKSLASRFFISSLRRTSMPGWGSAKAIGRRATGAQRTMRRIRATVCLAAAVFGAVAFGPTINLRGDEPPVPRFNRDVLPVLSDLCFRCHGPDEAERSSGLRLDTRDGLFSRGEGGPIIVPGDSGASELWRRISTDDADLRMPPPDFERTLTDAQRLMIRGWIEAGAEWQPHWAFVAPERSAVPSSIHNQLAENPIDQFINARLVEAQWKPARLADKSVRLRRVTLDLTGLPPTLDELDAFLADDSPDAYERAVDRSWHRRLTANAWRAWLDAARYADTSGYQNDGPRDMWLAGLGHRSAECRHAVRPIHRRTIGGRSAAERDAGTADRHRLQSQSSR
ncbi:MAG: DUF1549 domain-containing protein [Pirellulaceae bacterium]